MSVRLPHRMGSLKTPLVLSLLLAAPVVARAQIEEPRIPLQTKRSELYRFRMEYAEAFNKKDGASVVAMFAPDAIVVDADGTMLNGITMIRSGLTRDAANWPHLELQSDSLAIYGNTAVDVGTARHGDMVTRYTVVLRRDMNGWKLVRFQSTPVKTS
jgi:ketosteroid isomerase-like protein